MMIKVILFDVLTNIDYISVLFIQNWPKNFK